MCNNFEILQKEKVTNEGSGLVKYNTRDTYGSVAKWLHWSTALFLLASYVSVYFRHWFTDKGTIANWTALQLHMSFGMTIGVIIALRIMWRNVNMRPDPESGTRFEHLAASIGHKILYSVMAVAAVSGYIGTGSSTNFFFLFDITKFEDSYLFSSMIVQELGMTFEEFEKPVDFLHKKILGKWLVWVLIFGHVGAALYHHLVKKDNTLRKMI